jgi:hypothetical protein
MELFGADSTPAAQPAPDTTQLEQKFSKTMTNAVLVGRWTLDGDDMPPKTERYTISSVTKLHGDLWLFNSRIQFGSKDVTVPLIIPVKWAGDTPVISVTDMGIPGIGAYTARVLIYDDRYVGTWSGSPTHGGTLFGRIEHPSTTQPAK